MISARFPSGNSYRPSCGRFRESPDVPPGRRCRIIGPVDEHAELAILAVIAARPSHPYAVLDHLGQVGIPASRSALYRNVDALVAEGFLVASLETGGRGPARRKLALSDRGSERLAWLADRAIRQLPLQSPLFSVAIGAAACIGRDRFDEILRYRLAAAARELTAGERRLATTTEPGRLVQQRIVAHLRADVGWLQQAIAARRAG